MSEDEIQGKVAAVINDREAAINLGREDGVKIGDRFAILAPGLLVIPDPETGDDLGVMDYTKVVVKVVQVNDAHLSTVRTFRTIKGRPGLLSSSIVNNFAATSDRVETFNVDREEMLKDSLDPEDLKVRRGDPVVRVTGNSHLDE